MKRQSYKMEREDRARLRHTHKTVPHPFLRISILLLIGRNGAGAKSEKKLNLLLITRVVFLGWVPRGQVTSHYILSYMIWLSLCRDDHSHATQMSSLFFSPVAWTVGSSYFSLAVFFSIFFRSYIKTSSFCSLAVFFPWTTSMLSEWRFMNNYAYRLVTVCVCYCMLMLASPKVDVKPYTPLFESGTCSWQMENKRTRALPPFWQMANLY